jgi:hypothetical protein
MSLSFSRRWLLAGTLALGPTIAIAACARDDKGNTFGPTFGDLPFRDARVVDGQLVGPDGEPIAPDGAPLDPETCPDGTIAVVAGDDDTLRGAVSVRGKRWVVSTLGGGAAKGKPSLVRFGAGFIAATHGSGDALQTATFTTAWSPVSSIGVGNVNGAPSLAVLGTAVHVVYAAGASDARLYHHGKNAGSGWDEANTRVGDSFGTVSAGLAAVGDEAVFAENGGDEKLYVRSYTSGSWSGATPVNASTVGGALPATPELLAIEGTNDLVLVFAEKTTRKLSFATRTRSLPHTWSAGAVTHPDATVAEKFALGKGTTGAPIIAFRGNGDGRGYYLRGQISSSISWLSAQAIGPSAAVVDSTPAITTGVCGAEAIAAYASGGAVSIVRLMTGIWSAPEIVPGLTGTRVAIATR